MPLLKVSLEIEIEKTAYNHSDCSKLVLGLEKEARMYYGVLKVHSSEWNEFPIEGSLSEDIESKPNYDVTIPPSFKSRGISISAGIRPPWDYNRTFCGCSLLPVFPVDWNGVIQISPNSGINILFKPISSCNICGLAPFSFPTEGDFIKYEREIITQGLWQDYLDLLSRMGFTRPI